MIGPPWQTGAFVEIGFETFKGLNVNLPKSDHPLLTRTSLTRGIKEMLAVSTFWGGSGHGLHEFKAHHFGIELIIGLGVMNCDGDVMKTHRRSITDESPLRKTRVTRTGKVDTC